YRLAALPGGYLVYVETDVSTANWPQVQPVLESIIQSISVAALPTITPLPSSTQIPTQPADWLNLSAATVYASEDGTLSVKLPPGWTTKDYSRQIILRAGSVSVDIEALSTSDFYGHVLYQIEGPDTLQVALQSYATGISSDMIQADAVKAVKV